MNTDTAKAELLSQVSRERLMETNRHIAAEIRLSGSPEERRAFEYVQATLDEYGLQTTWLDHQAFVSYPLEASIEITDSQGNHGRYPCLGHAFSANAENSLAPIIDLEFGTQSDYALRDIAGNFVLLNGLATPTAVHTAEHAGAAGVIFINDDHLHNMIVTTIWGTPTPESQERLPGIPVVSIVESDGHDLRKRIAAGKTVANITSRVYSGWKTTPIVIGELKGRYPDEFVMLSGHLDSWDYGAMDNGSANATMLEIARLISKSRESLWRGLRVIFWSGHSHGRYSGSTWYADHYWEDLYDHCVAHVNVDSTGARGAVSYGTFQAHQELAALGANVIQEQTGQVSRSHRMSRAGDMSFNGIGIPALFMELSQVPFDKTSKNYVSLATGALVGSSMPWWWHTSEDTMDKVDANVLELDTRVYLDAVWRLTSHQLLPMDFGPVVQDVVRELTALQQAAGPHLDLHLVLERAMELQKHIEEISKRVQHAETPDEINILNKQMIALSRILIPLTYTSAGNFDHDPAWSVPFLPSLQGILRLKNLDPQGNEYGFLLTRLSRNLNQVAFELRRACQVF